jgi:hypothetical protein
LSVISSTASGAGREHPERQRLGERGNCPAIVTVR